MKQPERTEAQSQLRYHLARYTGYGYSTYSLDQIAVPAAPCVALFKVSEMSGRTYSTSPRQCHDPKRFCEHEQHKRTLHNDDGDNEWQLSIFMNVKVVSEGYLH